MPLSVACKALVWPTLLSSVTSPSCNLSVYSERKGTQRSKSGTGRISQAAAMGHGRDFGQVWGWPGNKWWRSLGSHCWGLESEAYRRLSGPVSFILHPVESQPSWKVISQKHSSHPHNYNVTPIFLPPSSMWISHNNKTADYNTKYRYS